MSGPQLAVSGSVTGTLSATGFSSATGCHAATRSCDGLTGMDRRRRDVLGARDGEQSVDQPGQPAISSWAPASSSASWSGAVHREQVEPQPQRGERGAQLMRDVGHHRRWP